MLITSGGASMGSGHDAAIGARRVLGTVSFGQVAMQSEMPQGFGPAGAAGTPVRTLRRHPIGVSAPVLRAVRALARSGALIIVPAQLTARPAGAAVRVLELPS
jgi:molybdopterin biosynthesis enzyme